MQKKYINWGAIENAKMGYHQENKMGCLKKSRKRRKLIFSIEPHFNPTRGNMQNITEIGVHWKHLKIGMPSKNKTLPGNLGR